uniref:RNI-like superfamily protein n=1 Tax=Steinernema glaseri TaxID=37863 RepID=A0A1I7XZ69_9BILA
MNSVPDAFLDAVCCTLDWSDLAKLKNTCGVEWSSKAAIHHSRRRELTVFIDVNHEGTEVGIVFKGLDNRTFVSSSLGLKYSKITRIYVNSGLLMNELPEKTSMERFKKKVLPILRSLAFGCTLSFTSNPLLKLSIAYNLADSIFSGLHGCSQLTGIYITGNYAGNCAEFIKNQISLGRLKELHLEGEVDCPADVQAALRLLVKSPNFERLDVCGSNLTVNFCMADAFVERFSRGDLSRMAELQGRGSFPLKWLKVLHRDKQQLNYRTPEGMTIQWDRPSGGRLTAKHISDSHICLCSY